MERTLRIFWTFSVFTFCIFIQNSYSFKCDSGKLSLNESCICELNGEKTRIDVAQCSSSICIYGRLNKTGEPLKCICDKGFQGLQCQLRYCKYGQRNEKNDCVCEKGYKGENCDTINCENGGKPLEENTSGWEKCDCLKGFIGKRCEIEVPDCGEHGKVVWVETSDFVKENLLVVDPDKKLMCHCEAGFTGDTCEKKVVCSHGILSKTGFCKCDHNWRGPYCDNPICEHGTLALNTCICEFGWGSQFCDTCLWGQKDGDICIQYSYSSPMKDQMKSQEAFKMSQTAFWLILALCSVLFLIIGCWFQPRKHLGVCFPSLRYRTQLEQNDVQLSSGGSPRVLVMQDSGVNQIVVNVVPRNKKSNSGSTNDNQLPSPSSNGNGNNNRRHSTGSRPPSYTKVTEEEEELLPTYRDALTRAKSVTIFIDQ